MLGIPRLSFVIHRRLHRLRLRLLRNRCHRRHHFCARGYRHGRELARRGSDRADRVCGAHGEQHPGYRTGQARSQAHARRTDRESRVAHRVRRTAAGTIRNPVVLYPVLRQRVLRVFRSTRGHSGRRHHHQRQNLGRTDHRAATECTGSPHLRPRPRLGYRVLAEANPRPGGRPAGRSGVRAARRPGASGPGSTVCVAIVRELSRRRPASAAARARR